MTSLARLNIQPTQFFQAAPTEVCAMNYPYDYPAIYAIHAAGIVDFDWAARIGGLTVTYEKNPGGEPISVLKGSLPDQAALLGVLTALYNARYPLLFVSYLRSEKKHHTCGAQAKNPYR